LPDGRRLVDHPSVKASSVQVRSATIQDADAVGDLASRLVVSFPFSRARFHESYATLLSADDACVLVATDGDDVLGYLLGVTHGTFYANGPVAWVQEIFVHDQARRRGIGRALMLACEAWATERGCGLVSLATRRAAPFYLALGFEESAAYLRKVL